MLLQSYQHQMLFVRGWDTELMWPRLSGKALLTSRMVLTASLLNNVRGRCRGLWVQLVWLQGLLSMTPCTQALGCQTTLAGPSAGAARPARIHTELGD